MSIIRGKCAGLAAAEFNRIVPVGTPVKYCPIIGEEHFIETKTRSEAWELGHGAVVVKVEGKAGGVILEAIELCDPELVVAMSQEICQAVSADGSRSYKVYKHPDNALLFRNVATGAVYWCDTADLADLIHLIELAEPVKEDSHAA